MAGTRIAHISQIYGALFNLPSALTNFRKGDPYTKIDEGYARLPGDGYTALHPELEGIDPEKYPDIVRMRILADVAPYSREYQKYAGIVRKQAHGDPDLQVQYEQIAAQVRQTKDSTLQVAQRHFNAPVDTIEGTVKKATAAGVELAEYPGRVFYFSSVGSSMADLTAEILEHETDHVPSGPRIQISRARAGSPGPGGSTASSHPHGVFEPGPPPGGPGCCPPGAQDPAGRQVGCLKTDGLLPGGHTQSVSGSFAICVVSVRRKKACISLCVGKTREDGFRFCR
jgi:hypothetical protein